MEGLEYEEQERVERMCSSYTGKQWWPFEVGINVFDQVKTFSNNLTIVLQWWHLQHEKHEG